VLSLELLVNQHLRHVTFLGSKGGAIGEVYLHVNNEILCEFLILADDLIFLDFLTLNE
jgi:hypothetical protein